MNLIHDELHRKIRDGKVIDGMTLTWDEIKEAMRLRLLNLQYLPFDPMDAALRESEEAAAVREKGK